MSDFQAGVLVGWAVGAGIGFVVLIIGVLLK